MTDVKLAYPTTNCHCAYQLNGSLTVFWRQTVGHSNWLTALQNMNEAEGIRILRHRFAVDLGAIPRPEDREILAPPA